MVELLVADLVSDLVARKESTLAPLRAVGSVAWMALNLVAWLAAWRAALSADGSVY